MTEKETVCGEYKGMKFCLKLYPPRPYQKEAIKAWEKHHYYGAIKLPTGTGKTLVAIWAWAKLGFPKMVIVVPTNALKQNHIAELKKFGLPEEFITTKPRQRPGLVAIITYALLTRNPELFDKLVSEGYKFWVFDETHHSSAEKFFMRVFRPRAYQLSREGKIYVMGISATPHGSGAFNEEMRRLLPLVYAKTYADLKEYLAPMYLYLVATPLSPEASEEYAEVEREYRELLHKLARRYGTYNFQVFARHSEQDKEVKRLFYLYNLKKNMLNFVKNKDKAIVAILRAFPNEKAMIFSDRQDQLINIIYDLKHNYGIPGTAFVQKVIKNKKLEKEALEKFREGKFRVLGVVKKGEEGVNFPEASIEIIVSTPKNERAIIQRVGRVIRRYPDKIARVFYLYVPGTEEEELAKKMIRILQPDKVFWINMKDLEKVAELAPKNEQTEKSKAVEYLIRVRDALEKLIKEDRLKLEELERKAREYQKKYEMLGWSMVSKDMAKLRKELEWALKMSEATNYMVDYLAGELSEEALKKQLARLGVTEKDIKAVAGEYAELIPKPIKLTPETKKPAKKRSGGGLERWLT